MRLINIDTCVSCKIGYQSVFFQFVMGGCHWNVQHWPRFGVLWQMFSMNANRVWIHERSKDLELGLVDYELRDIFLEGINHCDKCGFSWIEFCEAKLPCLVNSGSLDKCRIDWWSLITQRCGNSKNIGWYPNNMWTCNFRGLVEEKTSQFIQFSVQQGDKMDRFCYQLTCKKLETAILTETLTMWVPADLSYVYVSDKKHSIVVLIKRHHQRWRKHCAINCLNTVYTVLLFTIKIALHCLNSNIFA